LAWAVHSFEWEIRVERILPCSANVWPDADFSRNRILA
jgi:hypothetical protein